MLYRIQHDLVDIPKDKYLTLSNQSKKNTSDSRSRTRFYQERIAGKMYPNTFFPRTIVDWNGLASTVTAAESLNDFHARLSASM